jgi:opacity protein-like surface antigen
MIMVGLVVLLCAEAWSTAYAGARNTTRRGIDYLEGVRPLDKWSAGLYWDGMERDVEVFNVPTVMKTSRVMAWTGYSFVPWASFYLAAGEGFTDFDNESADENAAFGAGVQLNLLDHEIPDLTLIEDRIQVHAGAEVTWSGTELAWGDDLNWVEFTASLTAGLVNDLKGNTLFIPQSINLYAGPVFSGIRSNDIEGDEASAFGLAAGLEVFYTKRVSLHGQYNKFDNPGFSTGFTVRF